MKLYQTEKVNPLMGCLPLLLQIPVFFGLFHVLRGLNPANPAPASSTAGPGDSGTPRRGAVVHRAVAGPLLDVRADWRTSTRRRRGQDRGGILVLIMMVTTFMTSRQMILKTGWSQDPQQRMIQKLMLYGIPFSLLLSGWYFPIGVIIYWVTQNLFSLGQQFWVLHKYPPPVTAGSIPMKSARSAAAPDSPGSWPASSRPSPLRPSRPALGAARGFLRRKPDELPAAPEARSLAPKPGSQAGEADAPRSRPSTNRPARTGAHPTRSRSPPPTLDDHYRRGAEGSAQGSAERSRQVHVVGRQRCGPGSVDHQEGRRHTAQGPTQPQGRREALAARRRCVGGCPDGMRSGGEE
jgi:YidC/Oxa1 family membrane protein insertase